MMVILNFIHFARFDPMSTFLAMAADMAIQLSRPDQYGYAQDENIQAAFAEIYLGCTHTLNNLS